MASTKNPLPLVIICDGPLRDELELDKRKLELSHFWHLSSNQISLIYGGSVGLILAIRAMGVSSKRDHGSWFACNC